MCIRDRLYNICDNVPSTIILILISYVASPSVQTLILGMSITGKINRDIRTDRICKKRD